MTDRLVGSVLDDGVWQNHVGVRLRLQSVERPVEGRHRRAEITPRVSHLHLLTHTVQRTGINHNSNNRNSNSNNNRCVPNFVYLNF